MRYQEVGIGFGFMWIDAHCHLSDARVYPDVERILRDCARAGVTRFILGGVDPVEWERQAELDRRFPGSFLKVFGLHPWWVHALADRYGDPADRLDRIDKALELLGRSIGERDAPGAAVAIGETGLDGARGRLKAGNGSRAEQIHAFRGQLSLARTHRLPLVLHIVRAHNLALEVLSEPAHAGLGGMVHSFSGSAADARAYLRRGWLLSFSSAITYPRAGKLREVLRACPPAQLVFETDAPDQPPHGHEGPLHSPVSLFKVVQEASAIRNEPAEGLLARSRANLERVFRL